MLVSDDDRTDMIEYKSLGVRYKVEFPQISLESLADISVVRVNFWQLKKDQERTKKKSKTLDCTYFVMGCFYVYLYFDVLLYGIFTELLLLFPELKHYLARYITDMYYSFLGMFCLL